MAGEERGSESARATDVDEGGQTRLRRVPALKPDRNIHKTPKPWKLWSSAAPTGLPPFIYFRFLRMIVTTHIHVFVMKMKTKTRSDSNPVAPMRAPIFLGRQRREEGRDRHAAQEQEGHEPGTRAGLPYVWGVQELGSEMAHRDMEEGPPTEEQQPPDWPVGGLRDPLGGAVCQEGGDGGGEGEGQGVECGLAARSPGPNPRPLCRR